MSELFVTVGEIWQNYIWGPISGMGVMDWLDILILTAVLYGGHMFIRGRRAGRLIAGFVVLISVYVVTGLLGLRALHRILAGIAPFTVILLAIVFQTEIRDALEKLGSNPRGIFSDSGSRARADVTHTINCVVETACLVALTPTDGAIIVLERNTPLGDIAATGQALNADVSTPVLRNIFIEGAPLHDGAVIIRNNRIAAAGCKLPLTYNEDVVKNLGTRHRAAVGITEVSDCVVVVVSEEKHVISVANNGNIKRGYNKGTEDILNEEKAKVIRNDLTKELYKLLVGESMDEEERLSERRHFWSKIKFRWKDSGEQELSEKELKNGARSEKKPKKAEPQDTRKSPVYKVTKTLRQGKPAEPADEIAEETPVAPAEGPVAPAETPVAPAEAPVSPAESSAAETPAETPAGSDT